MSRSIPIQLQQHLRRPDTTTCRLLKMTLRDGRVFGFAATNTDIEYDDGFGPIVYHGMRTGIETAVMQKTERQMVANAEAQGLIATDASGITEEMIEAGELQDAEWIDYLVNYEALGQGHLIVDAGDVGEVKKRWGMIWIPELLSYSVRMRQASGTHWSRTCRAPFGHQVQGQFFCGVDAEALWVTGEVTAGSPEPDLVFTIDAVPSGSVVPGRVQAMSGPNAGRIRPVEAFDAGVVTLASPFPFPMEETAEIRIRPDCAKTKEACQAWGNYLNMKAEPLIPTGDGPSSQTPGAEIGGPNVGDSIQQR